MGRLSALKCPKCDYRATVCGGPDVGLTCATVTISCSECRELMDVVSAERASASSQLAEVPVVCRNDAGHVSSLWRFPGPCPRCAEIMQRDRAAGVAIWD